VKQANSTTTSRRSDHHCLYLHTGFACPPWHY
jgi:hypothetical protein